MKKGLIALLALTLVFTLLAGFGSRESIVICASSEQYRNDSLQAQLNEKFPQYLDYDETAGTITPVSGLDEEPTDMNDDMQKASFFIRFFTALMNFLKKLFSGEIDLGGLLGGEEA